MDAPEELRLLEEFANSIDVDTGADELADTGQLASWLVDRGLLNAGERATDGDLDLARRLRAGLRAAIAAHHEAHDGDGADGHGADAPEAAGDHPAPAPELDEVALALPLRVTFSAGEPRLTPAGSGVAAALARLLADVMVAEGRGTWARLKICPADDCAWVFYDQSKNRSRRWCSMGVCGNRTKVRAYRARTRG